MALLVAAGACGHASPPVDAGCPRGSVVALGDSITYGLGLERDQAYPAVLAARLGRSVCNAGVSGDNAAEGLARLQRDALQFHPSVVVILFGANDSGLFAPVGRPATPMSAFQKSLTELVTRVRKAGGVAVLASLTPFNPAPLEHDGLDPRHWQSYDDAIRSVAAEQNVPLIDMGAAFAGDLSLLQDGVHPTAAGAARMAQAAAAVLARTGVLPPASARGAGAP
jgi:lysophospholipase L1-like esterase